MDYVGRRMAIIINSILFLVGAIILALAPSFAVLVSLQQSDYYLLLLYYYYCCYCDANQMY